MFGGKIIELSDLVFDGLVELIKEENLFIVDSVYGGKRFGFTMSSEWCEKYNVLLQYCDDNFQENNHYEFVICKYFTMLSQCHIINEKLYNKLGLTKSHISALHSTYYKCSTNDDGIFSISLDYKKPFGNSDVIGDILDFFDIEPIYVSDDFLKKLEIEHNLLLLEMEHNLLLDDVIGKIKNFFINIKLDREISVIYDGYDFSPSPKYIRQNKIKNILK